MVELKKKEAECLEAPQEHGNATSPGIHPCVREREGTRVRTWSGCQRTWGFYLWSHVLLSGQLFLHLFPFFPIIFFKFFHSPSHSNIYHTESLWPCPIPWHHACLFVRMCWSLKIGQPLNNYSDLIFLPASLFIYCILSENSPQSSTGV